MKKFKYFLIPIIIIIAVIAFIFPSVIDKPASTKNVFEEILEVDHSKEIKEVLSKFDSIYNANILESGAVGGAVAITYKGQIAMLKCFGERKVGENSPVNENTVFRLASVSKSVTGVLSGILASENEINLDDKVADYLSDFKLRLPENTKSVTIRHLLSHTSGLVAHAYDMMVEDKVPLGQIIQRLNEVEIVSPPGLIYAYQNVMFSLFDPIVEAKTHKSFQQNLNEKVFKPFGMKNASSDFESFQHNENKAFPHQKTESGFAVMNLNDRYYITVPAAGINASISDLAQFLIAISNKNDDLFSNEARKIVFTPQIETPLKRTYYKNWDKIDSKQYGIGWRIIKYKNHTIVNHGGYVSGYQSEIAVCEEDEIGIAVLTNSPNSYFSMAVPTFFNLYFEFKNKQKSENTAVEHSPLSKP
ncbi:MAG TPA: serine hydrolase domain-containing protein [Draconibacterium sp.]|nr:serine hydrolase domain-containing protein [Draconibacterium sp.]